MAKLRVGVLEIIGNSVSPSRIRRLYEAQFRKHYASIAPQAVAVWCRELGHDVHYATYYGQKDPKSLLPHSLDIVFLATDTQSSALAYALAKLYRKEKTRTVIGGPHATSFPTDCLRFFDLVVHDCDRTLIGDILRGSFDRPTIVTSGRAFTELPSVEERLPEIITASFNKRRRPTWMSSVPLLSSVGCPYRCDFCIDWNHPYLSLPRERLEADLRYVSQHLPGVLVSYHDPNFGIRIDQILDIIETLPEKARNRYVMESSLSVLRGPRLPRLRETNCIFAAPGVESWGAYS
ncbi:MAG: radical SAM protein, partial [bacterium]|nr:radical SAM protein [bacterium]